MFHAVQKHWYGCTHSLVIIWLFLLSNGLLYKIVLALIVIWPTVQGCSCSHSHMAYCTRLFLLSYGLLYKIVLALIWPTVQDWLCSKKKKKKPAHLHASDCSLFPAGVQQSWVTGAANSFSVWHRGNACVPDFARVSLLRSAQALR